ncbi:MFS general substrate transporter [Mycena sanguinolenta]|uniref:MFS general substrate transporter n=1 Tax=Mycena sanguinolenta TaxID=230812 RepID=A0A8H6ZAF0_9AGAR|nr:MFS general substrate transporter [Mycena sanguinolenta]
MFGKIVPPPYFDPASPSEDNASDDKKEEIDTATVASLVEDDADDFPDGGLKAWIVICANFMGCFATFGLVNSWGVFQAYYQQNLLHHSTPSEMRVFFCLSSQGKLNLFVSSSWIGSIQHAMILIPAVLVGRLFDIGYFRIPFAGGSLLVVLTTFLVPECKIYWHFMLCQGFGVGIGCGLMVSTMITTVTHWFKKRRGFALGVIFLRERHWRYGSAHHLASAHRESRVRFPWAMRTLGFMLGVLLIGTNLCIARRLPPVKTPGGILGLHVFGKNAFSAFCVCTFITYLGLFTMLTYISSSAIAFGISPNIAFYFVAVANFSSGIGRLISGLLGDRFGAMNVVTIFTAVAGGATIAWPFCRTIPSIVGISILYGFASGAWLALIGSAVGQMGSIDDLGRRIGAINTVAGIGAVCGPPISGLFADSKLGYIAVGYFAGSAILVGSSLIFVSRWIAVPHLWRKF